jgi:hypothetical protein
MSGNLDHSPAQVIQHYLIDQGLAFDPADGVDWAVYHGHRPPEPDNCVTLYDVPGTKDGRKMVGGEVQEHVGIQIAVRSTNVAAAYLKCKNILINFDSQVNRTLVSIGSVTYRIQSISRTTDVINAGREPDSGCHLSTANVTASLRQLPGTGSYDE